MSLRQVLETFGKNLEARRKEKKLTQSELANLVGVKQSNISRYEKGEVPLGLEMLCKFAAVLETTPDALISQGNAKRSEFPGMPPRVAEILRAIEGDSWNDLQELLETAVTLGRGLRLQAETKEKLK